MKKLILILSMFLVSCGYAPMDNTTPIIITDIQAIDDLGCNYYGKGNQRMSNLLSDRKFKFRDTCGKFQIGDTLNIVKQ